MARYQGGFAEGFKGGFGLVNDFNTQKAREREAEQTQAFRQEELGLRKQTAADAAEQDRLQTQYRQEERTYRRKELALAEEQRLARIAKTEKDDVARSETSAANAEYNTARLAGLADQREINAGVLAAQRLETERAETDALNLRVGGIFSNLRELGDAGDFAGMQALLEASGADLNDRRGNLSHLNLVNPETGTNMEALRADMETLANGEELKEVSPESLAVFDVLLNKERSRIVGQTVDNTFVNAPKEIQNKGYKIVSTGVSDLRTGADQKLRAQSWVKVVSPDGEILYYPASTTKGGSPGESAPQELGVAEGMKGFAGYAQLQQYMTENPLIRTAIEEHQKAQKWGSVAKFESAVTSEVNKIFSDLAKVETDSEMPKDLKSYGFKVGGVTATRQEIRQKVTQNFLYGPPKANEAKEAKAFYESVEKKFPTMTVNRSVNVGNARGRSGQRSVDVPIQSLVDEGKVISLKQKLSINALAGKDGHVEDSEKLRAYLIDQRLIAEPK